ncbi:hypothetical protein JHK85_046114 [Glycine max]|nr:hypothetical protein JHK86_045536 [Glycine max]KAG4952247.1 hypothetical protein JHK85_046114 [Glycine max]
MSQKVWPSLLPLVRFSYRPRRFVFRRSARMLHDIVWANRPRFLAGKYIGNDNTSMAFSPYGDHWRNLRRIITLEVLSTQRLNSLGNAKGRDGAAQAYGILESHAIM